ncbi:MAG: putative 2-aminoethylphosphonate ABC transporter substrate-binding protein [Spirochaetales bacterium]|nr:putative 2-aminoethylphosphonate ABC transporter substrate-binding protein [Spirochaetales bacterium]
MKKIVFFIMMLAFISCSNDNQTLIIYTALENDIIPAYIDDFHKNYPEIKYKIVRDSTGIIASKILAEKDNPTADVIWGLAATSLIQFQEQEMLEGYAPKGIEKIKPQFKDNSATPQWAGIDAWMTAIVVNTIELEKRALPTPSSYQDLLDPRYKGLITMPHPASSGTGYLILYGIFSTMGENTWEYLKELDKNIAEYTHSGSKPATSAGTGEYPIGISFGFRGVSLKKMGMPVEVIFPQEGSGWELEANALIKKAEIKESAYKFLDWAISDSAMQLYSKNYAIIASDIQVENVEGFPVDPLAQMLNIDLKESAGAKTTLLSNWNSVLKK